MVSEAEGTGHPPFGGFRVMTEEMGDGRQIHYYEWPDRDEPDEINEPEAADEPLAAPEAAVDDE